MTSPMEIINTLLEAGRESWKLFVHALGACGELGLIKMMNKEGMPKHQNIQ